VSVLAYCVAESEIDTTSSLGVQALGVQGAPVTQVSAAGFTVFFSESEFQLGSEDSIREGALAFHQVNDAIFRAGGIVPFRFPTLLANVSELEAFVARNREIFEASLDATRDRVQMEVWIYVREVEASPETQAAATSGRAYLLEKAVTQRELLRQAETIRQRAESQILQWAQAEQKGVLRCYALVARANVNAFREAASSVAANLKFRVTGPWPATKFMPLSRMQQVPPPQTEVVEL